MDFNSKTAVVTGAARGIGREVARALLERGTNVAILDVLLEDAAGAADELSRFGALARPYRCNVASIEDVAETGGRIAQELGGVSFLVNNAGIVRDRLLLRMTPEDWDAVIKVNLTGAFNCAKVFAPGMLKQREGRIVNISSVIGLMGNAGQANYAASKAGLLGLTKSLAREFAPRGVTVNAVAPGFIETAMTKGLSSEIRAKMIESIPMRRFGAAADVADVVVFLLSDAAAYITGQVVNCDGGMVMAG
ncbi:MAG: 3-oxoacyl-[acyl-carrier-protein] reductase [Chitinivibrionia bacterium]|nr:3-oxoacyl-[acyl-carrier-protein] reductase [Chitinivibrionia bacterium]